MCALHDKDAAASVFGDKSVCTTYAYAVTSVLTNRDA